MRYLSFLILFLAACGSKPKPQPISTKINLATLKVDGSHRLDVEVVPTKYTLDINVDPTKEIFSGKATINVSLLAEKQVIRMHAKDIDVVKAVVNIGKLDYDANPIKGDNGGLALVFDKPLAAGEIVIHLDYTGSLDVKTDGLYRAKEGEDWYAFTQFEPLDARKAFPCFDEPGFKTPFAITLNIPEGQIAASNAPLKSADKGSFVFEETKPLPTYLVAFAIGPFDEVKAEEGTIPNVPFRILTAKGKGDLAKYMLKRTPSLLSMLTKYFGLPYPYAKLDLVAVPNFSASGMENAGLITFRETLLLIDPKLTSIGERRSAISVTTHELAHMWFGDSVTMQWWDDLWLNEAFATWMARKVVHQLLPSLEIDVDAIRGKSWVMSKDSEVNARAIRQPIENGGDVANAFDGLTYVKGAALLEMFETWAGDEAFQKGIQVYLKKHANGSATTSDFLAALDEASGKEIGEKITTFLNQPGVPLIDMEMSCGKNTEKKTMISIQMKQSRFLSPTTEQGEGWKVPVCIRYDEKREIKVHCDMMDSSEKKIEMETSRCPTWIYPNANESGYYLWTLPAKDLKALNRNLKKLTKRERVGLFSNVDALVTAKKVEPEAFIKSVKLMAKQKHRTLLSKTLRTMESFKDILGKERKSTHFSRSVKSILRPHLSRIGKKKKKKEDKEITMIRPRLLAAMADLAEDKSTIKYAQKLSEAFFKDHSSVAPELLSFALMSSAKVGDAKLWEKYKAAMMAEKNPTIRRTLINALGSFEDPALQDKSLALALDGTLKAQDLGTISRYVGANDYPKAWAWLTKNYEPIMDLLGDNMRAHAPAFGGGFCTTEGKAQVESFFSKESGRLVPGAERVLSNTLGRIDTCISERAYLKKAVLKFAR